jgi:hypothetical protein
MRRIYEQAVKVLMWIGNAKEGTEKAFSIVRYLARAFDNRRQDKVPKRMLEMGHLGEIFVPNPVLNELKSSSWPAVTDIFTRPYFGRVWVAQEIIMSTTADVLCGKYTVPWPELYKALLVILSMKLVVDADPHNQSLTSQPPGTHVSLELKSAKDKPTQNRQLWDRLYLVGGIWEAWRGCVYYTMKYPRTLACLADSCLGHEVTDPRDRIYGMLGMAISQSRYGQVQPIQPDYTKTVEEVYRDACQWSIRDSGSLAMLDLCYAPGTNKLRNLPTWVPDLTSGMRKYRLVTDFIMGDEARMNGQFPTPLSTYFGDQFRASFNRGNDALTVRGLIIDTVSAVTVSCTSLLKHVVLMQIFAKFCLDPEPYPTGGTRLGAAWRTFLTNYVHNNFSFNDIAEAPAVFGNHFIAHMTMEFRCNLGLPNKLTGSMPDIKTINKKSIYNLREMYPEDVEANISIPALMAKRPFIKYLYDHAGAGDGRVWDAEFRTREYIAHGDEGRQFIFTKKGYMGLGPPCPSLWDVVDELVLRRESCVWTGDVVAIFAGSHKIWYLRRDRDHGPYRIIGHGYVYGVMEARWFDVENPPVMEDIELE